MKKIITTIMLVAPVSVFAQSPLFPANSELTTELLRSTVATIVLFIASSFILSLLRILLNNQLKKKMLQKGVSEEVIANMLPRKSEQIAAIKWFAILTAIALGLTIITFFPPIGIHSVIIMAVCVALGFLGYYFWVKKIEK
ncbi:hypothetical protein SIO70_28655 [Chitinophaga sancti]|uniref:hypothetical protein n=1 Tax=Chitinophaga sancti TaxID=1004 RepID=UPI002A74E655|nr:hypothetical protein [Chitinophaga sancti]WPQ62335.1 hypothetical protein SIO70_28655 [Chitinophaga sancti]